MAVVLSAAVSTQAQDYELDTASQMYAAIADEVNASLDTTTASYTYLRNAVNAALRMVQKDMPFTVKDTVTLTALTYHYTLNANFVRPLDGQPSGYRAERVDKKTGQTIGMQEVGINEFAVVTIPFLKFRVEGNEFIVNSCQPQGEVVYVYGPGEVTHVVGSGTVITYPPETIDRWAAVYYAAWTIATARHDDALKSDMAQKYYAITGKTPQVVQ